MNGPKDYYPLKDPMTHREQAQAEAPTLAGGNTEVWAAATGEFRRPKAGEWYLSGAEVAAYRARNDLSSEYWIARLVVLSVRRSRMYERTIQ